VALYSGKDLRAEFTSPIPFILPIYFFGYTGKEKPIDILPFVFTRRGAAVNVNYLDVHILE
jgi:hypothetical protein